MVTAKAPKIILDNDWETRSPITYLLALNSGWDVVGLVGDTCNSWALQTSLHALAGLETGNLSQCIPVHKGADMPLLNTPQTFDNWQDLNGRLVWQGAFAPMNKTAEELGSDPTSGDPNRIVKAAFLEGFPNGSLAGDKAAQWMIEQVNKYPGEIMIYSGGSLTNIALAIRMDSKFASLAKGLVIMGGHLDVNLIQATGPPRLANINGDV